jgi:hypothetical protein
VTQTPTATPTATPVASRLKIKPASKNFGKIKVGHPAIATLTLINTATSGPPITFASPIAMVSGGDMREFKMGVTTCSAQLMPREKCKLTLQFIPAATGPRASSVTIFDNASNANQIVPLSGKGE